MDESRQVAADGPFLGRGVVVVGGTSGIGAAVAERFVALGARVTVAGLGGAEAPGSLAAAARPSPATAPARAVSSS